MNEILLLIVICTISEIYLIIVVVIIIFNGYYYYKDGNKKGTNLKGRVLKKAIIHELVHARIANRFGFTDWKISHKNDSLVCIIDIDYDVLNWRLLFKFLKMCGFHFIFDVGICIIWVDVISICEYIQKYFLDVRRIIDKFIKIKKLNAI